VSSAHSHVLRHTRMCVAAQSSSGWCAERQIRLADHRNGEGTLEGETFAARVTMVFSRSVFRVFKCIHTRKGIFQLEGDTQVFFVECGYFGLSSRVIPRYREISRPVTHGYHIQSWVFPSEFEGDTQVSSKLKKTLGITPGMLEIGDAKDLVLGITLELRGKYPALNMIPRLQASRLHLDKTRTTLPPREH
jgi:hypothetical protein